KPPVGTDELPLTERANRAMERAGRLSLRRRDPKVEPEHVLLSVLDVEGRAGQVLRVINVDPLRLREAVDSVGISTHVAVADSVADADAGADAGADADAKAVEHHSGPGVSQPSSPRCASCGAGLDRALAHRVMRS